MDELIYVFEDLNNNATVVYDGKSLNDSIKEQAIKVEELPTKETPEGKIAVLKADSKTGEVWYEYVDEPIGDVESLRTDMNEAIMELSMLIAMGGNA